jgi:hypothetical protein
MSVIPLEVLKGLAERDREEGGAVTSATSGEPASLVPPSSDPANDVAIELRTLRSIPKPTSTARRSSSTAT